MSRDLAEEFAEMALALQGEPNVEETVERVLQYALKAVDCRYAGITFSRRPGRVESVASTDPVVVTVAELPNEVAAAPGPEVVQDLLSVLVSDARTDQRWPQWASRVSGLGVRSYLSTRMYTEAGTIGTLDLLDPAPDKFDVDDQAVAHILARHASVALSSARDTENLWQAIDARKLVGQAQGILMERYDLDADQAFAVLVRYSQNHNVKLRDIAQKLVSTRRLPE